MKEAATAAMHPQTCVACRRTIPLAHPAEMQPFCPACSGNAPAAKTTALGIMPSELGPSMTDFAWKTGEIILGVYEVLGLLGEGGMGRVYRVRHRGWNRALAVKVPIALKFAGPNDLLNFESECESWANLGLHPYVTTCYFVRRFAGVPMVFAEYVNGGSLHQWIKTGTLYQDGERAALKSMLTIAIHAALGLNHAHKQGLVHQDVKPANLLLTKDGVVKVADFGLAKAWCKMGTVPSVSSAQPNLVSCVGMTPAYSSPEQASGQRLSLHSDLWSWGVSVLEMFTGAAFWELGPEAPLALAQYLRSPDAHPGLSAHLHGHNRHIPPMPQTVAQLLDRCFRQNPSDRPASMVEAAGCLKNAYQDVFGVPFPTPLIQETNENEPLHRASLNNRAVSMIELGRLKDAVALLDSLKPSPIDSTAATAESVDQDASYNINLLKIRWWNLKSMGEHTVGIPDSGNNGRSAFLEGMLHLETGELYEAIELLGKSLCFTDAGFHADALNARGIGLLLVGETVPAVLSFQAALGISPERMDIVRNLALACYYDGQHAKAKQIFDRLAETTAFDSEDAIRYAAVLAAAGFRDLAYDYICRAVNAPYRSSEVLLTAAELLEGVQTFLPAVVKIMSSSPESPSVSKTLVEEVVSQEPFNLRANIDRETLPQRFGLKLGAVIQNNARMMVHSEHPSRIGGCIASSYRALTKHFRWGDVVDPYKRLPILLVSGIPALFLACLCAWILGGNAPLAAASLGVLILLTTSFFMVGRPPCNDLLRELFFLLPAALLPVLGASFLMEELLRQSAMLTFLCFSLSVLLVFSLWQLFFQRLTAYARAFPHLPLPGLLLQWRETKKKLNLSASSRHSQQIPEGPQNTSEETMSFMNRASALAQDLWPQFKVNGAIFLSRFTAGFYGWFIYLVPQTIAIFLLMMYLGIREGVGVYLPLLLIPLSLTAFSPRLMFLLNSPACVCIGILSGSVLLDLLEKNTPADTLNLVSLEPFPMAFCLSLGGVMLLLNWWAMRRCPVFIPEWFACNPKPWDIRQMVDPLNIRRFAAPWQLSNIEAPITLQAETGNKMMIN